MTRMEKRNKITTVMAAAFADKAAKTTTSTALSAMLVSSRQTFKVTNTSHRHSIDRAPSAKKMTYSGRSSPVST